MQNTELIQFENKKVTYSLRDRNGDEVTSLGNNYTILWYDARMKNYIDLIKKLPKKKIATHRIKPVLVVDKLGKNRLLSLFRANGKDLPTEI